MSHRSEDQQPHGRRFRIWIQGRLGEHFTEGLDGVDQTDVAAGTMLSGYLIDQSRLQGVLDYLSRLGIEVLRFEVDPPTSGNSTPGTQHQESNETHPSEEERRLEEE